MPDGTTIKIVLMVMLMSGLVGATYAPWQFIPALAGRALAMVWSAIAWPDRVMQHLIPQRIPALARSPRANTYWAAR